MLANAIFLHKKANYKPIQEQMFEWARRGYKGEPPEDYFDANGQKRAMLEDEDSEYTMRKADSDTPMIEDEATLPSDLTFYQSKWKLATPLLDKLFRTPRVFRDPKNKIRTHLDQLNFDLKKKQQDDECLDVDLSVPVFAMIHLLVYATQCMAEANKTESEEEKKRLAENANRELALLKERINRAHQPIEWVSHLEETVHKKANLFEKYSEDPTKSAALWEEDFLRSLEKYSEPPRTDTEVPSSKPAPTEASSSKPAPTEAATGGNATGGPAPARPSSKSTPKGSGPQTRTNSAASTPFEASKKKGFVRYKLRPDYVIYLGLERKIGYSRLTGKFLRGDAQGFAKGVNSAFQAWHCFHLVSFSLQPIYINPYRLSHANKD